MEARYLTTLMKTVLELGQLVSRRTKSKIEKSERHPCLENAVEVKHSADVLEIDPVGAVGV